MGGMNAVRPAFPRPGLPFTPGEEPREAVALFPFPFVSFLCVWQVRGQFPKGFFSVVRNTDWGWGGGREGKRVA